jgi:hypothetical protein
MVVVTIAANDKNAPMKVVPINHAGRAEKMESILPGTVPNLPSNCI